ncbi:MAG: hypothetical protein WAW80_03720 [Candidatus Saccharimonadales bacterium]
MMAKDAELVRLRDAQNRTFIRNQDAYNEQRKACNLLISARKDMNRAYEMKQLAYDAKQSSWEDLQRVCNRNEARIKNLNIQQELAFQNMRRSYDNASVAYEYCDGNMASSYAAEGRLYKKQAQKCQTQRRQLVDAIRSAKSRHEPYRQAFQDAKAVFDRFKLAFDQAKAEHECKLAEFRTAKSEFDSATKAYRDRLQAVQSRPRKKRDDKLAVVKRS